MVDEERLPQVSEAQRIGRLAQACFRANMPIDWAATDTAGTEDFGYDYQVQDLSRARARNIFRVQLKGTLSPAKNASAQYFSIGLKKSTVRYYMRTSEAILLVLADLSVDPDVPKNCPLYYVWLHDELRRIDLDNDNDTVTLRIPTSNELTNTSDLTDDIERVLKLGRVGHALDISAEEEWPDLSPASRAELVDSIPANFAQRGGGFFDAMSQTPEESWPTPKAGTMPWHFKEADISLKNGDLASAGAALDKAEMLMSGAVPLELADYWFLRGRFHQFANDPTSERDAFAKASEIPNAPPKHVVAWAESEIRMLYEIDAKVDFSHVLARLTSAAPVVQGMRARVLAAEGKYDEAMDVARGFEGVESQMAKAIIHTMRSEFDQTIEACGRGLELGGDTNHGFQTFLMLRARALYSRALGLKAGDYDVQMPPAGPAHTNVDHLNHAWDAIQEVVVAFQRAGWPPNVNYLADIWGSTAIMLDKHRDALPLISQAAKARPHIATLQRGLEVVALHCGELELALDANQRLQLDDVVVSHRVMLLHNLRRDSECVAFFEESLPMLARDHPSFGDTAAMAILSAHRIVRIDLESSWIAVLSAVPDFASHLALVEFFLAVDESPLTSADSAKNLEDRYEKLGQPIAIAQQLIGILDPAVPAEAVRCKAIARRLESASLLNRRVTLRLAQALATLEEWQPLADLCVDARKRFSQDPRLAAYHALALDKLGLTSEAMDALRALIEKGATDSLAINTYIGIVIRCGFEAEAMASISKILSIANTNGKKLDCLRLMFNLVHNANPTDSRALDYAFRYGTLCDRNDEIEEGLFLAMILRAQLSGGVASSDSRLSSLSTRFEAFFEAFPKSKILMRAEFAEQSSGAEIMKVIREITGHDDDRAAFQTKMARQLGRGEIPIPYAWRPRQILVNVSDVIHLWEIGKRSKYGERQHQLTMATPDWRRKPLDELRGQVPVMDLVALAVCNDLGVFEELFQIFPRIAVAQSTIREIANGAIQLGGGLARDKFAAIQRALRANFARIQQPHVREPADRDDWTPWASEEMKILTANGVPLYSDDAMFRVYCENEPARPPGICTLDVLGALNEVGALTTRETAQKVSLLCSWQVGLSVDFKYQAAILPLAVDTAKSVADAMTLIHRDPDSTAIFNSIWDPDKPFLDFLRAAASLLRELVDDTYSHPLRAKALMGIWYGKAKIRTNTAPPLDCIALLVVRAAITVPGLDRDSSKRLIDVYSSLIEVEYGDRMDEQKERESLVNLGRICGEIDLTNQLEADSSSRHRLGQAFTKDTSDESCFAKGCSEAMQQVAIEAFKVYKANA